MELLAGSVRHRTIAAVQDLSDRPESQGYWRPKLMRNVRKKCRLKAICLLQCVDTQISDIRRYETGDSLERSNVTLVKGRIQRLGLLEASGEEQAQRRSLAGYRQRDEVGQLESGANLIDQRRCR